MVRERSSVQIRSRAPFLSKIRLNLARSYCLISVAEMQSKIILEATVVEGCELWQKIGLLRVFLVKHVKSVTILNLFQKKGQ